MTKKVPVPPVTPQPQQQGDGKDVSPPQQQGSIPTFEQLQVLFG
jgi:hypothetical protein